MHWPGFRRVRRQVCKRIQRRILQLGLSSAIDYRAYLQQHESEWRTLDGFCCISVSRFFRDRGVFELLYARVIPELMKQCRAQGRTRIRVWSAGCASGEEPYSLALLWREHFASDNPDLEFDILATDADSELLRRATAGRYRWSSLKDLPISLREAGFESIDGQFSLKPEYRTGVRLLLEDIREVQPPGPFELILCRNVVFTYFAEPLRRELASRLAERLIPGGALVIGIHEQLPDTLRMRPWIGPGIYRKVAY